MATLEKAVADFRAKWDPWGAGTHMLPNMGRTSNAGVNQLKAVDAAVKQLRDGLASYEEPTTTGLATIAVVRKPKKPAKPPAAMQQAVLEGARVDAAELVELRAAVRKGEDALKKMQQQLEEKQQGEKAAAPVVTAALASDKVQAPVQTEATLTLGADEKKTMADHLVAAQVAPAPAFSPPPSCPGWLLWCPLPAPPPASCRVTA